MIDDAHRRFSVWGGEHRAAKAEALAKPGGGFATFSGERERDFRTFLQSCSLWLGFCCSYWFSTGDFGGLW